MKINIDPTLVDYLNNLDKEVAEGCKTSVIRVYDVTGTTGTTGHSIDITRDLYPVRVLFTRDATWGLIHEIIAMTYGRDISIGLTEADIVVNNTPVLFKNSKLLGGRDLVVEGRTIHTRTLYKDGDYMDSDFYMHSVDDIINFLTNNQHVTKVIFL